MTTEDSRSASGPGVSLQSSPSSGLAGTWAQSMSPSAKGTGFPCCPLGPKAMALNPSLVQATLPSLLVLLPHTCHPPAPSEPTARRSPGGSNTPSRARSLAAKPRRGPGTPPSPTPWAALPVPLYWVPHPPLRPGQVPGPDPCPPLSPGCQPSWASGSRASAPAAPASQAVLPGKGVSSQGSGRPSARWGHRRGRLRYSTLAGHGSDLWGSGGSSGFFIPGFPKLLRLQAHEEHILGRALPQLQRHLVSRCIAPAEAPSHSHRRGLASCRLHSPSRGGGGGVSGELVSSRARRP